MTTLTYYCVHLDRHGLFYFWYSCILYIINSLFNTGFHIFPNWMKLDNSSVGNCTAADSNEESNDRGNVLIGDEVNIEVNMESRNLTTIDLEVDENNLTPARTNYCLLALSILYWCYLLLYVIYTVLDWRRGISPLFWEE